VEAVSLRAVEVLQQLQYQAKATWAGQITAFIRLVLAVVAVQELRAETRLLTMVVRAVQAQRLALPAALSP
jgi:hypothetical protein